MSTQDQIQDRITFLENQLASLDHYLPETYQFLMGEMDLQQRDLMALRIQNFYSAQDNDTYHQNPNPSDPVQTQEPSNGTA